MYTAINNDSNGILILDKINQFYSKKNTAKISTQVHLALNFAELHPILDMIMESTLTLTIHTSKIYKKQPMRKKYVVLLSKSVFNSSFCLSKGST